VIEPAFINSTPLFLTINATSLRATRGNAAVVDIPLERSADGRLTLPTRDKVIAGLTGLGGRKSLLAPARAYCALPASGLILRVFQLPATAKDALPGVLQLQLESELPLPPEELAWGWKVLPPAAGKQPVLVAAVRKSALEDYIAVLTGAGWQPHFTPGALARLALCPVGLAKQALLDVGTTSSELVLFGPDGAESVRMLPWGQETFDAATGTAEKWFGPEGANRKFYLTGTDPGLDKLAEQMRQRWQLNVEVLKSEESATLAGLKKSVSQTDGPLLLATSAKPSTGRFGRLDLSRPEIRPWLKRVAILILVLLLLPYVEALVFQPLVTKKFTAMKVEKERMAAVVDPELRFLQSLKQSQAPYLETLFLLARSVPQGTKLDPVSINQRGELSLRATFQNGQQVSDFRAQLNTNGMFTNVVVEEQSPTPDRQKVNIRLSARWNAEALRRQMQLAATNAAPTPGNPPPGGPMPPFNP
jgi:hypothetical protein